ncbi:MAG: hypothetical protein AB7L94_11345 [Kofleriaceae bacterium]
MTAAHDHSFFLATRPSTPQPATSEPTREPAPDDTRAGYARRPQPRSK